jgi:hypothetical protein
MWPSGQGDRGVVQLLIPGFLRRDHGGIKRGIFRLGFDIDEIFPVDGNPPEYLPDQGRPLLVGHPGDVARGPASLPGSWRSAPGWAGE